ncbi:hypothetical protein KSW81_007789 [Nannochloris sp. 'desiccata']|nr:hypothetical protein KSW81_007789 [Chlorella desiccata (nom. nud.)]
MVFSGPGQGSVRTRQQAANPNPALANQAATDTAAAVAAAAHATLTGSAVAAAQPTIDAAFVLKVSDHLQLYNGHSPDRKVFFGRAEPFFKTAALSVDRWRY